MNVRLLFVFVFVFMFGFSGCSAPGSSQTVSSDDAVAVSDSYEDTGETPAVVLDAEPVEDDAATTDGSVDTAISVRKEFTIEVSQWEYSPDLIEVNEGDTVVIEATSLDVPHSFTLPDFEDTTNTDATGGINVLLQSGKTETITFVADKKGEFTFGCDVVCGQGHTSMKGTLRVL